MFIHGAVKVVEEEIYMKKSVLGDLPREGAYYFILDCSRMADSKVEGLWVIGR